MDHFIRPHDTVNCSCQPWQSWTAPVGVRGPPRLPLMLGACLPCSRFCLINAGVLYVYFSNYLQIDEEEYGGTWELTKEGFMTSFALFMVCVTEDVTARSVIS